MSSNPSVAYKMDHFSHNLYSETKVNGCSVDIDSRRYRGRGLVIKKRFLISLLWADKHGSNRLKPQVGKSF